MTDPVAVQTWSDQLEACIEEEGLSIVDRVAVFARTGSTQDAAKRMAVNTPGQLVITGHQTTGRGRLGNTWQDDAEHSLAMTIALNARDHSAPLIALAAGVAVANACAALIPNDTLGLKWPNDLVERTSNHKLAGILVEAAGPLALVGLGINVSHTRDQLDDAGLANATSLAELGADADRITVAQRILVELDSAISRPEAELSADWRRRDTLTGTQQAFIHNGTRHEGIVESIDPTLTLVVRTRDGIQRLPALTTSTDDA